jgi:UTP--glucose-1-phosphate uridylyltransferase
MIDAGLPFYAREINGVYHDTGNKLEYLKTVVGFALERDDMKDEFMAFLKEQVK